jgi:hypothetical protein
MALNSNCGMAQPCPATTGQPARICPPARRLRKPPDDFPRLVIGYLLGLIMGVFLLVGLMLLSEIILRAFRSRFGPPPDWCLVPWFLAPLVLLGALPVVGAALLASRNRVQAARQTLSYSFLIIVLFAVVCGRPVQVGAAGLLALVGVGGLAGVCGVGWVEGYRSARVPRIRGLA